MCDREKYPENDCEDSHIKEMFIRIDSKLNQKMFVCLVGKAESV